MARGGGADPPDPLSPVLLLLALAVAPALAQFETLDAGFTLGDEDKPAKKAAEPAPPPAAEETPSPTRKPAAKRAASAPPPAPAAEKKAAASGTADLQYTLVAKRASFDPSASTLTLESLSPQIAAVRDEAGSTGKQARRGTVAALFGPTFLKDGKWLGGASGALLGASGAVTRGLALDLGKPTYDAATAKVTFADVKQVEAGGAPVVGGGVAGGVVKSGKGSTATSKVTLNDVVLLVDAVYTPK